MLYDATGSLLLIAFGVFLIGFGAYSLYGEIRATVTDEPSPVTFSDEPESLSVSRRAIAWVGAVFSLLAGPVFVYMGALNIYVCIFVDAVGVAVEGI